jgi:hypothetical protein
MFYLVFYVRLFRNDLCAFLNKMSHFLSKFLLKFYFYRRYIRYSRLSVTTEFFKNTGTENLSAHTYMLQGML